MRVANVGATLSHTTVLSDKKGQARSHIASKLDTDHTAAIMKIFSNPVQNSTRWVWVLAVYY
jgi:hypothetical protein